MNIQTAEDWWEVLEKNWDDILKIVFTFVNPTQPASQVPGDTDSMITGRNQLQEFLHLKKVKDGCNLARYMNAAWHLASDSYAWSVDGWGDFCNLLSEEHVLHEEDIKP